jgi:polyisoprenoid-binding protein YceI
MSARTKRFTLIGLLAALVVGGGATAFLLITGGSGQASTPIHAECDPEIINRNAGATVFRITPEESEVRFVLSEVLFGTPTTVTGRTDQVAGDILINLDNPTNTDVCLIRINARTLVTNNEFRNRAIRGQILQSAQDPFEFSTFVPTAVEGLPDSVEVGDTVTFQVTGDLTVRDIVQPVTFDVTATLASETRLEGAAVATVQRADYNLTIPSAPGVADVSEEVSLEIDFVANAVPPETSQN